MGGQHASIVHFGFENIQRIPAFWLVPGTTRLYVSMDGREGGGDGHESSVQTRGGPASWSGDPRRLSTRGWLLHRVLQRSAEVHRRRLLREQGACPGQRGRLVQ